MALVNKVKSVLSDVKTYWNTPAMGNYMPIKELKAKKAAKK